MQPIASNVNHHQPFNLSQTGKAVAISSIVLGTITTTASAILCAQAGALTLGAITLTFPPVLPIVLCTIGAIAILVSAIYLVCFIVQKFKNKKIEAELPHKEPVPVPQPSLEEINKINMKTKLIRNEIRTTENTLKNVLHNSIDRVDRLIRIKTILRNIRAKPEFELLDNKIVMVLNGKKIPTNIQAEQIDIDQINKEELSKINLNKLKKSKKNFEDAYKEVRAFSEKLDQADTNQEIVDIYNSVFDSRKNKMSNYTNSLAKCVADYSTLSKIDPRGSPQYVTTAQRMPRHVMLISDLMKNSHENKKELGKCAEKIAQQTRLLNKHIPTFG